VPERLYLQTLCAVEMDPETQRGEEVDGEGKGDVTKKGLAKCPHNRDRIGIPSDKKLLSTINKNAN
jgi:hypothetical protein